MLTGIFTFLGSSIYHSTKANKDYYKSNFLAKNGQTLELNTTAPLVLTQLTKVVLVVDIVQGKFPQHNMVSYEVAK